MAPPWTGARARPAGLWADLAGDPARLERYDVPASAPPVAHLEQGRKLLRGLERADTPRSRLVLTFLLRALALPAGGRVLEIGPGCGQLAVELCRRGYDYTGFDMVPQNVSLWTITAPFYGLSGRVLLQDVCAVTGLDETFDGIVAVSTFEHVHDRDRALGTCFRLLRPGGRLVILDGNAWDVRKVWEQVVVRWIRTRGARGGPGWLLHRDRVYDDYGLGWRGKDEAVKSILWWRRRLPRFGFRVLTTRTSSYLRPTVRRLGVWPCAGSLYIVAERPG
jgi:SAM-dependent methyltransferase